MLTQSGDVERWPVAVKGDYGKPFTISALAMRWVVLSACPLIGPRPTTLWDALSEADPRHPRFATDFRPAIAPYPFQVKVVVFPSAVRSPANALRVRSTPSEVKDPATHPTGSVSLKL